MLIDVGRVNTDRVRKSIGVERTFPRDLIDLNEIRDILVSRLLPELIKRIDRANAADLISGLSVKVKFKDFQQTTVECQATEVSLEKLELLLTSGLARRPNIAIRLLGIGVRLGEAHSEHVQYELF